LVSISRVPPTQALMLVPSSLILTATSEPVL